VEQKEIAEDLVRKHFFLLISPLRTIRVKSNVKTWLFSILKHKIADHYRSKYKKSSEFSSSIIDEFFDKNHRWKPEYRPTN
jgi:RNA polymerase sigma-70 factor (ECF subfamily)